MGSSEGVECAVDSFILWYRTRGACCLGENTAGEQRLVVLGENTVNLLANLTEDHPANCDRVVARGALPVLFDLLQSHGTSGVSAGVATTKGHVQEAVSEGAAMLLQHLATQGKYAPSAAIRANGLPIAVALLSATNGAVQECGASVLASCCTSDNANVKRAAVDFLKEPEREALLPLTWMCDHTSADVSAAARACVVALRSDDDILPFIEQGCVPALHQLTASDSNDAQVLAKDLLGWLQEMVSNNATLHVLTRTLKMRGNEEIRSHIATALVHLCFGAPKVLSAFLDPWRSRRDRQYAGYSERPGTSARIFLRHRGHITRNGTVCERRFRF